MRRPFHGDFHTVTVSTSFRHVTGIAVAIFFAAATGPLAAQQVPTKQELSRVSPSGNYLAARHAGAQRDALAAAAYYLAALRNDPRNPELLNNAFISVLASGEIDEAVRLAERVLQIDRNDRVARLVLGIRALKQKQYLVARQNLAQSVRGPVTDLVAALLIAWSFQGSDDSKSAIETIDRLTGAEWYGIFKELHAGLILDLANKSKEAGKHLEQAHKLDATALRVVQAYSSWLSRNGRNDEAIEVAKGFDAHLPRHPLIVGLVNTLTSTGSAIPSQMLRVGSRGDLVKKLQGKLAIESDGIFGPNTKQAVKEFQQKSGLLADGIVGPQTFAKIDLHETAGGKAARLIESPQAGAAEVLYGLGASLGRRGGQDLGLVYLQLAIYLTPSHSLALLSLADLYEAMKKPELAISTYERIPSDSPLHRNAEIQLTANLDSLDRTDEAIQRLEKLIAANPKDIEATVALGNIQRARKRYADCAQTYGRAIETIESPERSHWTIFYFRGICFERAKDWPKAEASLKKALELFPEQPHVQNYLGYSWIDQGINLEEGVRLIKRAVEQRPDDGYIVDSLGWAHYRLGNYEEAAKQLERAVGLRPDDPTINDHLGDSYWRVGRTLEAQFQWSHARDLKPEPEELAKIEDKLRNGLPNETSSAASADKPKKPGNGG